MTPATTWIRYKGDGSTPSDAAVQNRGETGRYLADPKLVTAVNTALAVEQPLLVTGEPGTGKTMLAWSIASELGLGPVLEFHTRSDNQARDTLYDFDYLLRFYHAQTRDARAENLESYVRWQALGEAIRKIVEEWPSHLRVAIIGTGHLSLELGGPRQFGPHGPDPEFDRRAVEWIATGDLDNCLREVSLDSLHAPGNATHGFMDFMLMMGVAGAGAKADYVDTLDLFHTMEAYFTWYPNGVPA